MTKDQSSLQESKCVIPPKPRINEANLVIAMGQPSPLLQLPREIRDQIWLGVCGKRSVVIDDSDKKTPYSDRIGLCNTLPLFHVCRQIQDEVTMAADATYTSNKFCFATTSAFAAFASQAADGDVAAIEKVRVRISREAGKDLDQAQRIICHSFAGLRKLLLYSEHSPDEFFDPQIFSMTVFRATVPMPGISSKGLLTVCELIRT